MVVMRRTLGTVGAWLVATGIAILIAWLGVLPVRKAVTGDVNTLSASDARRLAPPRTPSASASPPAPVRSGPVPSGFETVPDGKGGTAFQRTYEVNGGAATIRFAPGAVDLTATAPAAGFRVSFENRTSAQLIVTFTSPQKFSRIEASWQDDSPQAKTSEGST
jgi:hypothetical protein